MLSTCFVNLLSQSRVFLSISDDGLYCKALQKVNHKKVPIASTLLTGIGSAIFCAFFSYDYLAAAISLACLLGYGSVCIGSVCKRYENSPHKRLRIAYIGVLIVCAIVCGFSVINEWPLAIQLISLVICVAVIILYGLIKPSWKPEGFSCPGFPYIPLIGGFFNFFMFGSADGTAWFIFGVFMLIGVIIYFSYSMTHSSLLKTKTSELLVLEKNLD